jgi:hypothetical protein
MNRYRRTCLLIMMLAFSLVSTQAVGLHLHLVADASDHALMVHGGHAPDHQHHCDDGAEVNLTLLGLLKADTAKHDSPIAAGAMLCLVPPVDPAILAPTSSPVALAVAFRHARPPLRAPPLYSSLTL